LKAQLASSEEELRTQQEVAVFVHLRV